jgi:hypothetical protein
MTSLQIHSIAALDVLAHKHPRHSTVLAMIEAAFFINILDDTRSLN